MEHNGAVDHSQSAQLDLEIREPFRNRSQTWAGRQLTVCTTASQDPFTPSLSPVDSELGVYPLSFTPLVVASASPEECLSAGTKCRGGSRRNPWGSETYADLIVLAIESHPQRRATLQQIYEFLTSQYTYFSEKSDPASSAGWKNSIRHNLSLHNLFLRCPKSANDCGAKSSMWSINPSAKRRVALRRRAGSMDAVTKMAASNAAHLAHRMSSLTDSTCKSSRASTDSLLQPPSQHVSFHEVSSSTTSPPTATTSYINSGDLNSSPHSLDKISEQLCMEVVRRIILDEDEGDLFVSTPTPIMSSSSTNNNNNKDNQFHYPPALYG